MSAATVVIGRIGRPHGIHGALHARASGPTLATIGPGEAVEVRTAGGDTRRLVLVSRAGLADQPILVFEGLASREDAAALVGAQIAVDAARVGRPADPDTFFVRELIGCGVVAGERSLGTVTEVLAAPANDVLEVTTDSEVLLVPFTADAVTGLDVPGRRIELRADLFAQE